MKRTMYFLCFMYYIVPNEPIDITHPYYDVLAKINQIKNDPSINLI